MGLLQNTFIGFRYKHWTIAETTAYFVKGVARELKIATPFANTLYEKVTTRAFNKKWLKKDENDVYFDFNGAKLPATLEPNVFRFLHYTFDETFLIPCFYNDKYEKEFVRFMDQRVIDGGLYGYSDGAFNVTIEKGDIVIDAGAWIGDYSAYAASKGATIYSFEPDTRLYELLCKTRDLNKIDGEDRIFPVPKALGSRECKMNLSLDASAGGGNSLVIDRNTNKTELVDVTTLDSFVEKYKLKKVDFIKADIEGGERDLLKGASHVLKTFAPKLAICTYHLPDDPEVLEEIIKEANPDYKIVHLRHKLFAAVVKQDIK